MMAATISPYKSIITNSNEWQQDLQYNEWVLTDDSDIYKAEYRIKTYNEINNDVIRIKAKAQEEFTGGYNTSTEPWTGVKLQNITFIIEINKKINDITDYLTQLYTTNFYFNSPATQSYEWWMVDKSVLTQTQITTLETFINTTNYVNVGAYNGVQDIVSQNSSDTGNGNQLTSYFQNPVTLTYAATNYYYMVRAFIEETNIETNYTYNNNLGYVEYEPLGVFNNIYLNTYTTMTWEIEASTDGAIDIVGTLFEILGMPFAFISYAFNLTLFPGTAYSLNISHLFLALLVSGIVIFVIKKIYK